MEAQLLSTRCCVVGGGPAGIMLGYLLARAGVPVTILEKHRDFFRDFRGDTVHPSTLELLFELGLLEQFLKVPHQRVTSVSAILGDFAFEAANFSRLKTHCRYTAIMPQWDFLDFLSEQGGRYRTFDLRMEHEALDVIYEGERVAGVLVRTPDGTKQIRADLVIACDGRHSTMRAAGRLEVRELGVPIDVLWFRISRRNDDPENVLGYINFGKVLVLINRGDYFQAGLVIPKNAFDDIREKGMEAFRTSLRQVAPFLGDRVQELQSWDQVKLLSVQINRLKRWSRPGLLCIGDAAHAMSPAFGIGINLAIQDAVATANILQARLRDGKNTDDLLQRVQRRRELRTRITQRLQTLAHAGVNYGLRRRGPLHAPWQFRLAARAHLMQPILLHVVGIGSVPEHISKKPVARRGAGRVPRIIAAAAGFAAAVAVTWRLAASKRN